MKKTATASLLIAFALGLGLVACEDDPVADDDEEFAATLGPEGSVQTNATGSASFVLDDNGVVSYTIDVSNITGVTAAHIHGPAGAGEGAGVIVGLFTGPDGGTGTVNGQLVADEFVAADLSASAGVSMDSLLVLMRNGQSYVNVHTMEHLGGEIRGQITAQ